VFNRFWRADPARARTTGGTGLGLSIALEDAKLHRGWLQAWGEPGGGTQFRLTVPRTVGTELLHSPIRLEPEDSQHHQRNRRVPSSSSASRGLVRSTPAPAPGDSSSRLERYPGTFVLPGPGAAGDDAVGRPQAREAEAGSARRDDQGE
jgi:two-component system sensor histidine kinase MtrB